MQTVKSAVSLRKSLFEKAERAAKEMKIPRSRLYSLAIEDFLRRHESQALIDSINASLEGESEAEETEFLTAAAGHFADIADEWK